MKRQSAGYCPRMILVLIAVLSLFAGLAAADGVGLTRGIADVEDGPMKNAARPLPKLLLRQVTHDGNDAEDVADAGGESDAEVISCPSPCSSDIQCELADCGKCKNGRCFKGDDKLVSCPSPCSGDFQCELADCGKCQDGHCFKSNAEVISCPSPCKSDIQCELADCGKCKNGRCFKSDAQVISCPSSCTKDIACEWANCGKCRNGQCRQSVLRDAGTTKQA